MDGPDIAEAAVARAWNAYLLIKAESTRTTHAEQPLNSSSDNVARRATPTTLNCWPSKASNFLKKLEEFARRVGTRTVDRYREKVEQSDFPAGYRWHHKETSEEDTLKKFLMIGALVFAASAIAETALPPNSTWSATPRPRNAP